MTLTLAATLTRALTAGLVLLHTLELLTVRAAWSEVGTFPASVLAAEVDRLAAPVRLFARAVAPEGRFTGMLVLRALVSFGWLLLALTGHAVPFVPALLLVSQLLVSGRFRGTLNGGSDAMTVVLLVGCTVLELPHPLAPLAGLGWIAAQCTLSYFVAGVVKLRDAGWRRGDALRAFVRIRRYGVPSWAVRVLDRRAAAWVASWTVIVLECAFPLAFFLSGLAAPLVAVFFAFHLANWVLFGIHRFVHAWLATYPAVLAISALTIRGIFGA